ncbi:hypothetical protein BO70DRAFT_357256 [Aspergillus heteromorphus CBS 117.55]|uniref:Uncharacterized protein n=1 Tax=Aspergillus heteromorphus CBS 117.55 TaxID=1448321 RepID=A0A317X0E1_9EURO|nr:uncharacterized protein BO70DRAFT_357256 [Aspergillus heteromorphus CBS 117.55]PWY92119.1 hypothetical protein BO70DRAFT_357256 [Aspergillus heteromorphus CBS 117.55]
MRLCVFEREGRGRGFEEREKEDKAGYSQEGYGVLEKDWWKMMTMVPPTNGYARDLEQGKAGSVVLYHGTNHAGTGKIRSLLI